MLLTLLLACSHPHEGVEEVPGETTGGDSGFTHDTSTTGDDTGDSTAVYVPCESPQPILQDMYRHNSVNAEHWEEPVWIMGEASVPDIVVEPTLDDGQPWLYWMDFEDREDRCDTLVYASYDLDTDTLGTVRKVDIVDLPPLTLPENGVTHQVADPDIIAVGDIPVLFALIWPEGETYYCIAGFTGSRTGTLSDGIFKYQEQLLWCASGEGENITDPVALWVPDHPGVPNSPGEIHVWAASAEAMIEDRVANMEWILAVPNPTEPGTWYEKELRTATIQDFHTLGSARWEGVTGCDWGLWGSRDEYVRHACTSDFETWNTKGNPNPYVSDPSVAPFGTDWTMFVIHDTDYDGYPPD